MAGEAYFDFTLDFGNISIPRRLRITQYGDQLPVFRAKLYNMGTAYSIPEGSTVNVRWKKPSGTAVYNPITAFDGNTITYALDGQCTAVEGISSACFEITSGGKTIQTPVFSVEVVKNPVQQDDIEDSPEFDALDKALQETIDTAKAETDKIVQAAGEQAQAGFDDAVQRAKTEADRIAADATEQARQYAESAGTSATQSADSATRAEEAAKRAEAAAPVEGFVTSVNGMGGIVTLTAEKVPFDNAGTPFVSTTVQDAIEELLSIGGGGGAAISTITVTAPAGAVVTISHGAKSYTQTVGEDGAALTFKVLETGFWDVVAVLDEAQDTGSVNVAEAGGSYSITLDFAPYKAYIKVTGPDGATVNAAKGDKSVSGTISGGSVTLTVNEDGEWTITATYKDGIAQATTVNVLEEGETYTAEAKFATLTVSAPAGSTVEIKNEDTTLTGTADSGSIKFWLPNTGAWTVKATLNGQTASSSVDCAAYQDYTAELAYFAATIKVTAVQGATVKAVLDDYSVSGEAGSDGTAALTVNKAGSYTVNAAYSGAASNSKPVQVSQSGQQYTVSVEFVTLTVTAPEGSTIKAQNNDTTLTDIGGTVKFYLPNTGTWTVSAELDGQTASSSVEAAEYKDYPVTLAYVHIYGVSWDGTSTTKWTRTDDAADFVDPVPYVQGAESYGSPFDNLYPWSGMVRSTDSEAGELVSIPKFWYELKQNGLGMTIRIADKATEGFLVSPAHMNRDDGHGERDTVYIGRYHSSTSKFTSQSGQLPKTAARSEARTSIHNIGENIWSIDFATRFTIWLLYLVEFADWNSQSVIGYGCSPGNVEFSTGSTDTMPYHTGTNQSSREYGSCCQYRNIEGLWDGGYEWIDGCRYASDGLYIILNPNNFNESSGGVNVGKPISGWSGGFSVKTEAGFPLFIPNNNNGGPITYSTDTWSYLDYLSVPALIVGGNVFQRDDDGLFFVAHSNNSPSPGYGCRLMKLP